VDHAKTWKQDQQDDIKERVDSQGALTSLVKKLGISFKLFTSYITSNDHSHLATFESRIFSDSYDVNGRPQTLNDNDKQHLFRLLLSERFKFHTRQVTRPLSWKELLHLSFLKRVYTCEEQYKMDPALPFPIEKGTTQFFWKHLIAMEAAVRNNRYLWSFQQPTIIRGFITKEQASEYFQAATSDQELFFLRFSRNWDPTSIVYMHFDHGTVRQYKLEMITSLDEFCKFHKTRFQVPPLPLLRPGEKNDADFLKTLVSSVHCAQIDKEYEKFRLQYAEPSPTEGHIMRSKTTIASSLQQQQTSAKAISRSQTTIHSSASSTSSPV